MDKKLISEIQISLAACEQSTLFGDPYENLELACVKFLKHRGYTVVIPKTFKTKIKTTQDLIELFYDRLNKMDVSNHKHSSTAGKDNAVAKRMLDGRMAATGASKEYSLGECGEIVNTLFDNLDKFNFKYSLSFSVFGQSKLKWVTDKIIDIMNEKKAKDNEKKAESIADEIIQNTDTSDLGFSDLDDILKRMEEENG